jgi:hypothetical protein
MALAWDFDKLGKLGLGEFYMLITVLTLHLQSMPKPPQKKTSLAQYSP